jgi:hypothetical protein
MRYVPVSLIESYCTALDERIQEVRDRANDPVYPDNMRSHASGYADALGTVVEGLRQIADMARDDE